MRINVLVENTTIKENIICEHGLSLHIELMGQNILIDMGASDAFITNAKTMGVDLSKIDLAIVTHGHSDHGGGLPSFLNLNKTAKVYVNSNAFGEYYVKTPNGFKSIGINHELSENSQIILSNEKNKLNENITLFTTGVVTELIPQGNITLYKKVDAEYTHDDFLHEQNILITESGKTTLICGCAHKGITNILMCLKSAFNITPDVVIGGFHLHNPGANTDEDPENVNAIAEYLLSTNALFYTCHCTGEVSYNLLKELMKDKIHYLSCGETINI